MRIGIQASDIVAERPGGVEYSQIELIRHLPRAGSGNEYRLYLNFARGSYAVRFKERVQPLLDGAVQARVCRVPSRLMRMGERLLGIPIDWVIGSCDVVHYPNPLSAAHPQRRGARVVTAHDLLPLTHPQYVAARHHAHFKRVVPAAMRGADAIIAVSRHTKAEIVERLRVPEERVFVVHHGVDVRFRPATAQQMAAVRTRYALPRRYVLFVGTAEPRKNIPTLIDAAASWRRRGLSDVELVLVGQPWSGSAAIEQRIAARGLHSVVRRIGYVANADLPAVYSAAKAFVLPSLAEGFGMPLLEAMACGVPVIAADTTSLPEVLGEAGLLFNPLDSGALAQALVSLVEDSGLRSDLVRRGLARAATFTWEKTARQTLAVYAEVA